MKHFFAKVGVSLVALAAPVVLFAQATPIDTTAAVAQIGEIETAILAVGSALIVAAAVAVAVKWVKAALFG